MMKNVRNAKSKTAAMIAGVAVVAVVLWLGCAGSRKAADNGHQARFDTATVPDSGDGNVESVDVTLVERVGDSESNVAHYITNAVLGNDGTLVIREIIKIDDRHQRWKEGERQVLDSILELPQEIDIHEKYALIGSKIAFSDTVRSKTTAIVIDSSLTSSFYISDYPALTSISVADNHPAYRAINGVLFSKDMSILIKYPASKQDTSYVIPDGVMRIRREAFKNSTGLTSITIPNSVRTIERSAFEGCTGLESVVIPEGVTRIWDRVFKNCSGLKSVTIPNSVISIGDEAFFGCSGITEVTIPDNVTIIGYKAFYGCASLTEVTIPAGARTYIRGYAFANCTNLASVKIIDEAATCIWRDAFAGCDKLPPVAASGTFCFGSGYGCGYQCNDAFSGEGCGSTGEPCEVEVPDIEMVFVKGGVITPSLIPREDNEYDDGDNKPPPPTPDTLADFYIGKYEVTQGQWRRVMGMRPLYYSGDDFPVISVSPQGAYEFVIKLNELTGKNYRLPTNAEWEYAVRGGAESKEYSYSGSNIIDEVAWYEDIYINHVGMKRPNELGIHDMTGNAAELVNVRKYYHYMTWHGGHSYAGYYRGCYWGDTAEDCNISKPFSKWPEGVAESCHEQGGFRLVLDTEPGSRQYLNFITIDSTLPMKWPESFDPCFDTAYRRVSADSIKNVTDSIVLLEGEPQKGTFTDPRDGKTYRTVTIANKTWMAENLNFAPDSGNSWCYDDADSNCVKYGRLYYWETARKACPAGWRLPSSAEWHTLINAAGGRVIAGTKLKSQTGWEPDIDSAGNVIPDNTDDFGFSALPGGRRDSDGGFYDIGFKGCWWDVGLRTCGDGNYAERPSYLLARKRGRFLWSIPLSIGFPYEGQAYSIRCIRDD